MPQQESRVLLLDHTLSNCESRVKHGKEAVRLLNCHMDIHLGDSVDAQFPALGSKDNILRCGLNGSDLIEVSMLRAAYLVGLVACVRMKPRLHCVESMFRL